MKKGFASRDEFIATYCDQFFDHFIIDLVVIAHLVILRYQPQWLNRELSIVVLAC